MSVQQPGTPGLLRAMNDRAALALLLEHGPLTRARIGELTGLSKPTVSQVVGRLEHAGLVGEVGEHSPARGPKSVTYGATPGHVLGVAVDVRPQEARATVVDAAGTEHPMVEVALPRVAAQRSPVGDVSAAIQAACEAAGVRPDGVVTVMVGLQGAVDPRTDDLTFTGLLPGWPRRRVRACLEEGLGVPVAIDNDVNLAAVAERDLGAGRDVPDFCLLWIGEGLGVAVDLGGRLHRGASGGAGEIGYLPVPTAAIALDAEARDLQDLVGGIAVTRIARAHGVHGRTLGAVLEALGDHPARDAVLAEIAPRVAVGVLPLLAVLDPQLVVLGGATGASGGAALAELVRAHVRRATRWAPRVVASAVPDQPVLRGARALVAAELRQRFLDLVT
ncbi:ROK family transcriptional regulator [Cellulomonas alba]|uniref:ROK family transcriptional regulator n=1 Tax=Cellulomonas alba TaxID=3053467 RepID=A0ABT7SGC9_9CELL|nr:ROK family transcriptional regulator [Cellulomonas alba]MDM7855252.1 ROK family transcriptional regulator [Cellulomonas alba]